MEEKEEKENLAPAIQKLLDELEVLGYDRKTVAAANGYVPKTITDILRRGGNQTMLNKLTFYKNIMEQMKLNPDFDILKRVEHIEKMQDILLTALCDVLARLTQRSSAIIKSEYEKLIEGEEKK